MQQASPSHSPYRDLVHLKHVNQEARQQSPRRACVCLAIALFLYADIYHLSILNRLLYLPEFVDYVKGATLGGSLLLCVGHIASFAYAHLMPDREIEDSCAKLLNISKDDLGFKVNPDPQLQTPASSPNVERLPAGSFCLPSAQNSFSESFNNSVSSTSWQFQPSGRPYRLSDPTYEKLLNQTRYPNSRALDWHIEDEESAEAYLLERSREQPSFVGGLSDEFDFQPSRSRTSLIDAGVEAIHRLFQAQPYKAASPSQVEKEKSTESGSALICRKWNIDEKQLFKWNRNLRFWFHKEVFCPLVEQINEINKNISKFGYGRESLIGVASPSQLRLLAANRGSQLLGLENVVPFLEITTNQQYLVERFKEFAIGGALSKMNWNHGGPTWNDHLPPDAEILMFSFCTYIDTRLMPDPEFPDGRQFTTLHTKDSLHEKSIDTTGRPQVLIHHRTKNPPHYLLQMGDEIFDVGLGSANALHTIISFLYHQSTRNDGRICRMSMGPTGIDVLTIIT